MNKRTISRIQQIGLEGYVDNDFRKKSKRTNRILMWTFFLLGILMVLVGLVAATGSVGVGVFLIIVGLGGIFIGWLFKIPGKTNPGLDYKEVLTRRHGDYKKVLKEIETQLTVRVFSQLDGGFYATEDWLVILCSQQGTHFLHKSEIAAIIGTNHGTEIVWDDGQSFTAYFNNGEHKWDDAFMILAGNNPYLLSHGDFITTPEGELAPVENPVKNGDRMKLIAEQFLSNKEAGVVAGWYGELQALIASIEDEDMVDVEE